jgi:bifunctional DNase/RNase
MEEMVIDSIRVSLMNYQRVVILKQKAIDRYLPIWVGPAEADSIAVNLQKISVPRPLTHDLLTEIIQTLGGSIDHIVVSDLREDTFFAKIVLDVKGKQMDIDARPSDALALAVRTSVPIYADDSVLDKAGVDLDKEVEEAAGDELRNIAEKAPVNEEDIKKMSAFKDFIEGLNMEGLDK